MFRRLLPQTPALTQDRRLHAMFCPNGVFLYSLIYDNICVYSHSGRQYYAGKSRYCQRNTQPGYGKQCKHNKRKQRNGCYQSGKPVINNHKKAYKHKSYFKCVYRNIKRSLAEHRAYCPDLSRYKPERQSARPYCIGQVLGLGCQILDDLSPPSVITALPSVICSCTIGAEMKSSSMKIAIGLPTKRFVASANFVLACAAQIKRDHRPAGTNPLQVLCPKHRPLIIIFPVGRYLPSLSTLSSSTSWNVSRAVLPIFSKVLSGLKSVCPSAHGILTIILPAFESTIISLSKICSLSSLLPIITLAVSSSFVSVF